jgi:hypothetical protein
MPVYIDASCLPIPALLLFFLGLVLGLELRPKPPKRVKR